MPTFTLNKHIRINKNMSACPHTHGMVQNSDRKIGTLNTICQFFPSKTHAAKLFDYV